jgi:hypothetical protein
LLFTLSLIRLTHFYRAVRRILVTVCILLKTVCQIVRPYLIHSDISVLIQSPCLYVPVEIIKLIAKILQNWHYNDSLYWFIYSYLVYVYMLCTVISIILYHNYIKNLWTIGWSRLESYDILRYIFVHLSCAAPMLYYVCICISTCYKKNIDVVWNKIRKL